MISRRRRAAPALEDERVLRGAPGHLLHHRQPLPCPGRGAEARALVGTVAGATDKEKLLEHLRLLYSRKFIGLLSQELAGLRRQGLESLAAAKLERLQRRFCDLSLFVKEVKERFSRWFNKRRERRGTLWMERFACRR